MKHNKTWAITESILNNPGKTIKITEVAKESKTSKASVSLTVKRLTKEEIIKDWHVNMANPRTRALKILINIDSITKAGMVAKLKPYALGIGIYGSWAKGTNTEASDIDIWIKPKKPFKFTDIGAIIGEIGDGLGVEAQVLVLSKERLEQLGKTNSTFLHSLWFGSMDLYGEAIGQP